MTYIADVTNYSQSLIKKHSATKFINDHKKTSKQEMKHHNSKHTTGPTQNTNIWNKNDNTESSSNSVNIL